MLISVLEICVDAPVLCNVLIINEMCVYPAFSAMQDKCINH